MTFLGGRNAGVEWMTQQNKKLYAVMLQDGQSLVLAVEDMFTVQLRQQSRVLLNVRFQPLSSLNNLEMQPLYRVADMQREGALDPLLEEELLACVFTVYQYYTQGSIHAWRPGLK